MKRQRLLGIGNLVEYRQRIGSRLLRGLGGGTSLDPTPNEDTRGKDETGKYSTTDEQKENLSSIQTAAARRWICIDRHAPTPTTGLGGNRNHVCFAVAVHRF